MTPPTEFVLNVEWPQGSRCIGYIILSAPMLPLSVYANFLLISLLKMLLMLCNSWYCNTSMC